jgi:hypothetical protein
VKPLDPAQQHHAYGGVEHRTTDPVEDCLLCTLEAVATAWFEWDQQALDTLLHDYRKGDEDA